MRDDARVILAKALGQAARVCASFLSRCSFVARLLLIDTQNSNTTWPHEIQCVARNCAYGMHRGAAELAVASVGRE
ncbi:hypothetical protein EOS_29380 [Caballeronia mineralivorans PML1(12)]|uniref:Uncharacterized protein n=1 Tax=Caballeronia mineralivorans PML1(12) TaxID=908627 RepID=A0A0J1FSD1_9BURK|nr:hypothetical protein EOS_29380 [Caballeronia mineralivorans PML1(12)]